MRVDNLAEALANAAADAGLTMPVLFAEEKANYSSANSWRTELRKTPLVSTSDFKKIRRWIEYFEARSPLAAERLRMSLHEVANEQGLMPALPSRFLFRSPSSTKEDEPGSGKSYDLRWLLYGHPPTRETLAEWYTLSINGDYTLFLYSYLLWHQLCLYPSHREACYSSAYRLGMVALSFGCYTEALCIADWFELSLSRDLIGMGERRFNKDIGLQDRLAEALRLKFVAGTFVYASTPEQAGEEYARAEDHIASMRRTYKENELSPDVGQHELKLHRETLRFHCRCCMNSEEVSGRPLPKFAGTGHEIFARFYDSMKVQKIHITPFDWDTLARGYLFVKHRPEIAKGAQERSQAMMVALYRANTHGRADFRCNRFVESSLAFTEILILAGSGDVPGASLTLQGVIQDTVGVQNLRHSRWIVEYLERKTRRRSENPE